MRHEMGTRMTLSQGLPPGGQPRGTKQESKAGAEVQSGLGFNGSSGLCGWGLQVRLLRTSKAYKCPQAPAQLFCSKVRVWEKLWCDLAGLHA